MRYNWDTTNSTYLVPAVWGVQIYVSPMIFVVKTHRKMWIRIFNANEKNSFTLFDFPLLFTKGPNSKFFCTSELLIAHCRRVCPVGGHAGSRGRWRSKVIWACGCFLKDIYWWESCTMKFSSASIHKEFLVFYITSPSIKWWKTVFSSGWHVLSEELAAQIWIWSLWEASQKE